MHVVLVGAEFEENLAVRYLRGALERAGHQVSTVVFNEEGDVEQAALQVADSGAAVVGLSMVFTWRAREFARLARRARELGFRGHIVAGGHFAALHAERLLGDEDAIDSVACGEGESILCELCEHVGELALVDGLVWRRGSELIRNAPAVKPSDLDTLAWPPRKSPFDHYLGIPITNILSSRGCSRNCGFCSIAAWHRICGGERLRLRAPDRIAEEMSSLYERGVRIFNFHDDNFVLDDRAAMRARLEEWNKSLVSRGVRRPIAFAIKCRPDTVDRGVFALLKSMGMFRVFLGIEAGTSESLRQLGRGQTLGDNERALAILNDLDIHTCFNLLVFNPESTLEDVSGNVAFLRAHPDNAMNFCRTEIYAGTPLERRLRRQGRLLGDYWGYDYVIADPRAQTAFEIVYPAFEARNYGEEGLHHLTMQIDYEQQLLRRFFGQHDELREAVKQQIVEVNRNTCDHLDRIIEAAPRIVTARERASFTVEMRGRVEEDNALLGTRVQVLLQEIRSAAERPLRQRASRGWMKAAAAAGLAATVTLASAGCREKSHPTEMAPVPMPTTSGPPPKDASAAESADGAVIDAQEPTPPVGPAALVKPAIAEQVLKLLAEKVVPPDVVELEVWIAQDGAVSRAVVHRPELTEDAEKAVVERLKAMRFADTTVRGQRFVIYFSKVEVERGGKPATSGTPPVPTHMHERVPPRPEMAPRPPPRPEMAPRRTQVK